MNPTERRQRAATIAAELNNNTLLCQDVRYLLNQATAHYLTTEGTDEWLSERGHPSIRPQFDLQPTY